MRTIWGFDLGVTSIGFAVLTWDEWGSPEGVGEILRLGVRIFPETREDKDLAPKNAARRGARLARRQLRRRRWRRVHLRTLLAETGLLPRADARPPVGQDPYALRARGLAESLDPTDLGWAIFHLLKRRGFQGSRKRSDRESPEQIKEDEEAKTKSQALARFLAGRQLAEGLTSITTSLGSPKRRRGVGQTRRMVTDEFAALWAAQRPHHPHILTDALRQRIEDIALRQRPTSFRRRTIGQCDLEANQARALKADWLTQRFEMLQLVNALHLEGGNQRGLEPEERSRAIDYLDTAPSPTWAKLRTAIGLPRTARFTHERGKKESVRGNATEAKLREALGPDFPNHPYADAIREKIGQAWHEIEYRPAKGGAILEIRDAAGIETARDSFAGRARAEWGLSAAEATRLAEIDLPDGTGRHSLKAMRRLLPHLEAGLPYMTAVRAEYQLRESGDPVKFLPGPNPSELAKIRAPFVKAEMERLLAGIRNPTVLRSLNELQKVVNTLLRVHGRPDIIRVEFARDLKRSVRERRTTDSDQRKREKARAEARDILRANGKPADGGEGEDNITRLILHAEQSGRCPYSGQTISIAQVLDASTTEIDHIFPVSRSFDDSQANKVLCLTGENRAKRNATPYEYLASNEHWLYLTKTLWPDMVRNGWPETKSRRCQRAEFNGAEGSDFTNRQLVDTAFIARAARDYLGLLFGGGQAGVNHVLPVASRASMMVRRALGIDLGKLVHGRPQPGPKARDDHRHHAADALATALTTPPVIQALSRWWQARELSLQRPAVPSPWPGFHAAARDAVASIVVSHKVQAKLSGAIHEETRLGDTGAIGGNARIYVKRKPTSNLTPKEINQIRDGAVRDAINAAIAAADGDAKRIKTILTSDIRLPTKNGSLGPVIRRVRLVIPLKSGVIRVHPTKNIHAEQGRGTNDHIALYRDGEAIRFLIATKRESLSRIRRGEPAITPHHPEGGTLVMALRPGDVLRRSVNGFNEYRLIRKFLGSGQIFFKPLTMVLEPKPEVSKMPAPLLQEGWHKVAIDPIGRIRPAR